MIALYMSGYEYPNLSNTKEIELCKVVYGVVDMSKT